MTTALPFQAQQPIFGKVGGISELGHMSDEERFKYQSSLDMYRTNVAVIKNERAEGIEEGLTKGRAEGLAEGRAEGRAEGQHIMQIQIAQSMKQMGMSAEQVSQATGLTMEEINAM